MKKRAFSRILFSLLLLLFLILFAFLCICAFYHVSYTPEACTESADELSNPYIGFYSMYVYVLGNFAGLPIRIFPIRHLHSLTRFCPPGRNTEIR